MFKRKNDYYFRVVYNDTDNFLTFREKCFAKEETAIKHYDRLVVSCNGKAFVEKVYSDGTTEKVRDVK